MYLGILQDLGLTLNEAKMYQTLLEKGELTVSILASFTKIHRRNIYDNLKRLIDKGLVFQSLNQNDTVYHAVDPQQLLELIKRKEEKVKQILPKLQQAYQQGPSHEKVALYRGLENIKKIWHAVLTQKQPFYVYNLFPFWQDDLLKKEFLEFLESSARLEISQHYIFDPATKDELSVFMSTEKNGFFYKFFDQPAATPLSFCIFGIHVVNIAYKPSDFLKKDENGHQVRFYMVTDSLLAEKYLSYFKSIWQQL